MSNSRLEKFIYAICGMEVDDLPTPLSRIETLWNCLITGETPDFEPLSRNEKYLMSMLSGDIDGLPEPTSRSEKLLYKIATGETDLSDVPGYLSRYEELLKQLIENGGIGGTDFEYVLYTLNQPLSTLYTTAEGPVKSAILKGQTLVNQSTTSELTFENAWQGKIIESTALQSGKKYFVSFDLESDNSELTIQARNGNSFVYHIHKGFTKGKNVLSFILEQDVNGLRFQVGNDFNVKISNIIILEYQEGMENWDIPFFTGMQSVKIPVLTTVGKNLFNPNNVVIDSSSTYGYAKFTNNADEYTLSITDLDTSVDISKIFFGFTGNGVNANDGVLWVVSNGFINGNKLITTDKLTYFSFYPKTQETIDKIFKRFNIQIEQGTQATSFEPYKTNILTVNEPVELRGIGEVRDTLDCLTGEVTERIGEIMLDGSEDEVWTRNISLSNDNYSTSLFTLNVKGIKRELNNGLSKKCDKFPVNPDYSHSNDIEGIHQIIDNQIAIRVLKTKLSEDSAEGFNSWLSNNPLTVQYKLLTESVKTVDLSTLDQDGQPTKLKTFNDITYVSIEAEDLLPTVDLEVPTKIEETLSTLPKQMIDISETQQSLNEKIDAQAENINEVSTAITEIRSDIL